METLLKLFFSEDADPANKILIIILGIFFFVYGGDKGFNFIKNWKKKKDDQGKSPHENCPHYPSFIDMMKTISDKVAEMAVARFRFKTLDAIGELMNEVEITLSKVRRIYYSSYLTELRRKHDGDKTGLVGSRDAIEYEKTLLNMMNELKGNFKKWIKRNHFTDDTDTNYNRIYIPGKLEEIDGVCIEYLRNNYSDYFEIKREELFDLNKNVVMPLIEKEYTKLFFIFRTKAAEYIDKVNLIDKEVEATIPNLVEE